MTQTDWEKGALFANATASPDWERGAISGPPQAPGLLRSAGDSAVALGSGITQGVKMLTDVAGADNAASRVLGKATDALTDLSSPYAKAKKQERAEKIKAAEDSGSTWEEVKAYAGSFADAPLDTTLNALGTSAAPLAAGTLSGVAAIPAAAVRAVQIGLAAAQGVGGIKGQIHESVKQKHLDAGATEAEAAKRADEAQAYAGPNAGSIALGGALGAAAGGTGAESAVRRLAGQRLAAEAAEKVAPGVVRSAVGGVAKEAPMEMLQGGQERHASNTALQGEGFDVPTWQGVAGQAALEGLASAPMGGGFGAMEGMAHKGATQRQGEGGAAFTSGAPRTPPDSIKSVVAKARWVRGWDAAAADALKVAGDATGAAVAASESQPGEQAWTTSAGEAAEVEPGTVPASPANAPNLDYETLPGAPPEAHGNEIDFTRDFAAPDWGTELGAAGQQPAATAAPELTPSQAMGLDPNAGALSKAAAMAVDSGASPVVQSQVAPMAEQLTEQQQAAPQVPAGVDPDTGEVSLQAQMDELKSRIAFMQQQGAAQGWDGNRAAQRNALQTQLTRLELQAAGGQERGASTTGAPAPVQLTGINQILAKQVPDMNEQELQQAIAHYGPTHKRTKKLEKALQALAQKPLTAIESGANGNVFEADQAQQGSAQPAQTGAAQAGQDAGQGVGNGTTPAANHGAQEQGASLAKAQAQVSQAAGAAQAAVGKAAQIAREGNAEREAQRQRQLDASERWTRMTTVERRAVAATAPGLTVIARKNVHTRAWPDLGEKIREKLLDSLVAPATKAPEAQLALEHGDGPAFSRKGAAEVTHSKAFKSWYGDWQNAAHVQKPMEPDRGRTQAPPDGGDTPVDGLQRSQGVDQDAANANSVRRITFSGASGPTGADGAPVRLYHGTKDDITAFDLSHPGRKDGGWLGDGVYLTSNLDDAAHYTRAKRGEHGPNVMPLYANVRNPYEASQAEKQSLKHATRPAIQAFTDDLKARGHDGVVLWDEDGDMELVAFEPTQVKSVTGNNGNFDPANPDIRFRLQDSEPLAGADFDVASFLQSMDEGRPANVAKAAAPAVNVRPSYSPAARAEAVRAVKGTADAIRQAWANGPEVIVAFDMHDAVVPESARRADLKQRSGGARGAPEGFYYQGKVYLMASKLKAPNDAARVLFHEALGHHGLRGLFGKDLGLILNQIATMRKADVDAKIAEYGLRRVNRLDRRTAAEEVLAEMAQNTPQIGFVRRAVAAIRTWLRTHVPGFKSLALTDDELIRSFILPARVWVERGAPDGGNTADATFSREAAPELRVATNFMQARQAVKEFQGKPLTNDATGMTAVLARNSLDKMLSGKAVEKSETPATHAMAVANADSLFKQAILGWSKPDRSDDANIKAIHRFFAPMEVNGRTKLVKLTVKEGMRSDRGNPLYTVEAVELNENRPGLEWIEAAAREDGVSLKIKNPLQRGVGRRDSQQAGPRATLAQPHGMNPGRSAEDVHSLAQEVERSNSAQPKDGGLPNRRVSRAGAGAPGRSGSNDSGDGFTVSEPREPGKGSDEHVADERHSQGAKENLLKPRVSSVDVTKASERSGSTSSGDRSTVIGQRHVGKVSTEEVADEPDHLLTLDTKKSLDRRVSRTDTTDGVERSGSNDSGDESTLAKQQGVGKAATDEGMEDDEPMFSRSRFMDLKDSALDQLTKTFTHEGKVSLWDKSVGTMRHLAERAPSFKPVYESAQQNIDDVSMLANDAADMAPRILPRVESLGDLKKKPVSAADNKAVARPLFEGTLIWARDENGKPTLVDDLQKRYANLSAHNKAAMLLKHGKIDAGVLAMWQGLPVAQFEKLINSRFENKMLKPGIVWSDAELQAQFGTDANQISLYREARAAIDRSIDMTARTDMLRVVGEKYEPMRDAVLAQPSVEAAAQLLLDTLEQDAKADPDSRDRLAGYMQLISRRLETAVDLQKGGYAPLSRFGRYTVDVVDANGERLYFGMYETARDSNRAKMQLAQEFKGATITTGTMSAEAYKLFAGVTPETLEQFGEMLGLKSEGNEAQDKAFQEFLKLTKNNHSAMKRLIHRKGIAGFSEDVGRVVANFVYSNARAGAMGLNAGKMETAIGKIPKEQGELKDLAMGLRDYIRDPQEEGQAVRGMLFAQYLGGSIASAFVNTTQPFAVTLPWLSQYGGMKKAGAQMARALNDMRRSWTDKGFKYEADLANALQSAEDDGVVSPQEIHQLMAQARGAGMLRSGDGTKAGDLRAKAGNLWEQGKVLWGQPFALAEQFNRRSTFIASYRIAKDQGMADPAAFARKAVLETQFVYSKANKPKWARGAVGGTLFTFKTYSVSYLELMQRMWNQGPAGSPERAAGRRAVGWALAMLLLMSGAGGVPFMEDAEDLIDGAGQMMGYNISAKQWRKELLANVVGKELGEFMEQGLSGLPGAPIDVSGRLGMGNLLPGTGLFLNKPNRERDLMEIVGPAGDLVARGFTGARKLLGGDVAGAALEVSPTAVRNLAKGADMAATGMYRDTKGYKVIDTTLAEAAAKAIGFQPKSVAEVQEANSFMQRSKSFYTQTSSEIKAQWADALFRKDEAAVQRVRERLAAWNRDNPEQPIVVKMPDVWKRVREMGKDRSERIADTAPKALRQQMREQARSLG